MNLEVGYRYFHEARDYFTSQSASLLADYTAWCHGHSSVFCSCWSVCSLCSVNTITLICYYACLLLYLERLFCFTFTNITWPTTWQCALSDHRWRIYWHHCTIFIHQSHQNHSTQKFSALDRPTVPEAVLCGKVNCTMPVYRCGENAYLSSFGHEPVGGYITKSVMHIQSDARPTVTFPAAEHDCSLSGTNIYLSLIHISEPTRPY